MISHGLKEEKQNKCFEIMRKNMWKDLQMKLKNYSNDTMGTAPNYFKINDIIRHTFRTQSILSKVYTYACTYINILYNEKVLNKN